VAELLGEQLDPAEMQADSSTLTCPIELVKIRQQSLPPHLNPNVFTVTLGILRSGGLRGLYRGYSATVIRELAYGPYFWA
jgi:solute carrier family 25 carnitine/acylcarnitine transporter 20/29